MALHSTAAVSKVEKILEKFGEQMRWMQTYSWTETQVFQNIDTHSIKIDEFAEDWNLVDGLDSFGAYVLIPWFLPTIRQV